MKVSQLEFEYLRPPKDVFDVIHPGSFPCFLTFSYTSDEYILQAEGKKYNRRIFYKVQYNQFEHEKLVEFQALLDNENLALPSRYNSPVYSHQFTIYLQLDCCRVIEILVFGWFRYEEISSCKKPLQSLFNLQKNLKRHLDWRKNVSEMEISEDVMALLVNNFLAFQQ